MSTAAYPDRERTHVVHVSTVHRANDVRIRNKECASLVAAGYRVSLVARPSATSRVDDGVSVYDLPDFLRRRDRFLKAGVAAFRTVKALDPDVVHLHDPELLPFAPLFRLLKAKVIYDVHEDLPKLILARTWVRPGLRKVLGALASWVEPLFARACSGLVLVDPAWSGRFPARPSAICRNYPIAGEFVASSGQEAGPGSAAKTFVYVGDITPERGAYVAVEAISRLQTAARLQLAGPPSSPEVATRITELDEHRRTDLPGVLDRAAVQTLFRQGLAGLVLLAPTPAYENATATKIYEYMGAGLPMILSDTSAHRRIMNEHGCALVVSFDEPDEVASAMQQLIDDPKLRIEMGKASRRAFALLPKWEDDFENLRDLYDQLVAS